MSNQSSPKETEASDPGQLLVEAALRGDLATILAADPSTTDWSQYGTVNIQMGSTNGWTEVHTEATPLFAAAHSGNEDIVKFLIKNGADVNTKVERGYATTAAAHQSHIKIVEILLDAGASVEASEEALFVATASGNIDIVQLIMNKRVMAPTALVHALVTASSMGFIDVVTALMEVLEVYYTSNTRREVNELRRMIENMSEQRPHDLKRAKQEMIISSKEHMRIALEEERRAMRQELNRTREEIYKQIERACADLNEEINETVSKLRNDLIIGDDEIWIHLDKMHDALNTSLNALTRAPNQVETLPQRAWQTEAFVKGFELAVWSLSVAFGKLYKMTVNTAKFIVFSIVALIVVIVGVLMMYHWSTLEEYRVRNNPVWFVLIFLAILVSAIGYL